MSKERLTPPSVEQIAYKAGISAVREASHLVLEYWPNPNNHSFKNELTVIEKKSEGIANFATIADIKSEELIKNRLQGVPEFHNFGFWGEELGKDMTKSPYTWIIDPIDGTTMFSRGNKNFGVMLALMKENVPIIGIISLPAQDAIISAFKNNGVMLNHLRSNRKLRAIHPSTQTLSESIVLYDVGYKNRSAQHRELVEKMVDHVAAPASYFSSSHSIFQVAAGEADAFVFKESKIYDIAPGWIILEELEGKATQINGSPIDGTQEISSFVGALNPGIHEELISTLNS